MSVVQRDLVDGVASVSQIYSHTLNNAISRKVPQASPRPAKVDGSSGGQNARKTKSTASSSLYN